MTWIQIRAAKCDKCGHTWLPELKEPLRCPRCRSPKWNDLSGVIGRVESVEVCTTENVGEGIVRPYTPQSRQDSITGEDWAKVGDATKKSRKPDSGEMKPCRHGLLYCSTCKG